MEQGGLSHSSKIESFSAGFKFHQKDQEYTPPEPRPRFNEEEIYKILGYQIDSSKHQELYKTKINAIDKVVPPLEKTAEALEFRSNLKVFDGARTHDLNQNYFQEAQKMYNSVQQKEFFYDYNDIQVTFQCQVQKIDEQVQEKSQDNEQQQKQNAFQQYVDQKYDLSKLNTRTLSKEKMQENEKKKHDYNSQFKYFQKSKDQDKNHIFGGQFQEKQDFERYVQPVNKNQIKNIQSNLINSENKEKKVKTKKAQDSLAYVNDQEFQLLKTFFESMPLYEDEKVPKFEIVKSLEQNEQFLELYDIDLATINQNILSFVTKSKYLMSLQEFYDFVQGSDQQFESESDNTCLISEETQAEIQIFYEKLGKDTFKNISNALRIDPNFSKYLHMKAIFDPEHEHTYELTDILKIIEKNIDENMYLSFPQFINQFKKLHLTDKEFNEHRVINQIQMKIRALQSLDQTEIILKKSTMNDLIQNYFETSNLCIEENKSVIKNRNQNYIETQLLVSYIKESHNYQSYKYELARTQHNDLSSENVDEILDRILIEAHTFIDLEEFLCFFTIVGRPRQTVLFSHYLKKDDKSQQSSEYKSEYDQSSESSIDDIKEKKKKADQLFTILSKTMKNIDYQKLVPEGKQYKVTVPDPFTFDERERKRSKSIREKKLDQMLEQKKSQENFEPFKPVEVPRTNQPGLYQKIMEDNEQRRDEVRRMSKSMTLKNEKPFSFYYRDRSKTPKKFEEKKEDFRFFANPIPESTTNNLFSQIQEQEKQLKKDKDERKAILEQQRAEKYQQEREEKSKKLFRHTFHHTPVPDFNKLQQEFAENLEKKKKEFKLTVVEEFRFQDGKKEMTSKIMAKTAQPRKNSMNAVERYYKAASKYEKVKYKTTKKNEAMIELRKKEEEKNKQQKKQKEDEEYQRKYIYEEMIPQVKVNLKQTDQEQKALKDQIEHKKSIQKKVDYLKNKRQPYDKTLKEIKTKVKERPLLFEQCNHYILNQFSAVKRDFRIEEMKRLAEYRVLLKKNGVKDIKSMFNKDEWDLILDYDYLLKQGYKDFVDLAKNFQKRK